MRNTGAGKIGSLRDVYDTIVLKDIVQRAGGKDIDLFNRVMEYLVCNPSQILIWMVEKIIHIQIQWKRKHL